MSRDLYTNYQFGDRVSRNSITGSDLENVTLVNGEEITVWDIQVPADKAYVWGAGRNNRNAGNATFVYGDFLASGNGTNSDGTTIENADLVLAISDSTQEDTLAKTTFASLGDLADAATESRSDRPILPEMSPAAGEDRHLELRIRAKDSTSGGSEIASDSDIRLYYGEV